MASTNKTPNLGLNQWLPSDKPKLQDFNRDNEKIDNAVSEGAKQETGQWNPIISSGAFVLSDIVERSYCKIGRVVRLKLRATIATTDTNSNTVINITGVPYPANGFGSVFPRSLASIVANVDGLGVPTVYLRNTGVISIFFLNSKTSTELKGNNISPTPQPLWFTLEYETEG